MANTHETLTSLFKDTADAIRSKTGKTDSIIADNFPTEISSIVLGSGNATDADVLEGVTYSNDSGSSTGTMPNNGATGTTITTQGGTYTIPEGYHDGTGKVTASLTAGSATTPATTKQQSQPSISVDSNGLITASVAATSVDVTPTVSAGYISTGTTGTITLSANSNTKQLTIQAAKTITPSGTAQTAVAAGVYTTGAITVAAAANIAKILTVTTNTGISSVAVSRSTAALSGERTGTLQSGDLICPGDKLTVTPTAAAGYTLNSSSYSSSITVSDNTTISPTTTITPYTLTISTTNPSYISSYSVSRTSSPKGGAATGTLSSGSTIYYSDVLSTSCTAKSSSTSWGSYNFSSLTAPTFGTVTTSSIPVTNSNSYSVTCYYGTTSGATTYSTTIAANSTATISGLSLGTTYYFFFRATATRSGTVYNYSVSASPSSVTVTGNQTITFTGSQSTSTTSGTTTVNSSVASKATSSLVMPSKGNLITMTLGNTAAAGTNNQYRVLKVSGTQALVQAMYDYSTSQVFNSSSTTTTISSTTVQKYEGSALDTALNTTFYGTLNSTAKAAIVSTSITLDAFNTSGTRITGSAISRYIFALSIQDLIDYTGASFSTMYSTGGTSAGLWQMYWNTTSQPSTVTYPWTRSAYSGRSDYVWYVYGNGGVLSFNYSNRNYAVRPAFTIDLSKITFTKVS